MKEIDIISKHLEAMLIELGIGLDEPLDGDETCMLGQMLTAILDEMHGNNSKVQSQIAIETTKSIIKIIIGNKR